MGELIDVVNFLEIQNNKAATNNSDKLQDLIGQANFIASTSGRSPMSWYEFKQNAPEDKPNYTGNVVKGAGAGALVLAAATLIPGVQIGVGLAALTGAIFGGLLGGYHQTKNTSRSAQLDAYERYLNEFEDSRAQSLSQTVSLANPALSLAIAEAESGKNFADKVVGSKDCGCKKSRG